ncbi:MAG: hypothetical protein K0R24_2474, partial [Gammaproteobacteria bacterium]|nr:hypothetical protein [Gammaproteobacteria bacterium]
QLSEKERRAYERYMENLSLEASLIQTREVELASAEALGMEKGIEKGIKKVALRMLSNKVAVDVIAEMTGLTQDVIAKLSEGER